MSSDIRIEREYAHPRAKIWRALTDPAIMALWGMRPEGFAPVVGTHFTLHGTPNRAWRGMIECEVLDVRAPETIAYSWVGNAGDKPTIFRNTLQEIPGGTRLIVEHLGFTGFGGFLFTKLIMGPGLRQTANKHIPRVLADLNDDGALRAGSALKPLFPRAA